MYNEANRGRRIRSAAEDRLSANGDGESATGTNLLKGPRGRYAVKQVLISDVAGCFPRRHILSAAETRDGSRHHGRHVSRDRRL